MNELLTIFNQASGLNAHHVSVSYPDLNVEFDGYQDGKLFHIESGPCHGRFESVARTLGAMQRHRVMDKLEQAINYAGNIAMSDGTTIKDMIAKAKARKAAAIDNIATASANLGSAVGQIEAAAKQLDAEAMDLQQAVADLTNGAP